MQYFHLKEFYLGQSDNGVPPRWFGFPGNPDEPFPHIVRMTEGLEYTDIFKTAL